MLAFSSTTHVFELINIPICCFDASLGFAIDPRLKIPRIKKKTHFFNIVSVNNPVKG
jgi:hypothetical protein